MRSLTLLGLVLVLLLGACSGKSPAAPAGAETAAKRAYDRMAADDLAGFTALGSPDLKATMTAEQFHHVHGMMPKGLPASDRLLRWNALYPNGDAPNQITVIRDYTYSGHVVLAEVTMLQAGKDGPLQVQTFNIRVATNAELAAGGFTLRGRSFLHYLALTAAIMSPLICLTGLVIVIRAPKFKLKWLFAVLSLIAFVKFTLNWSTGDWGVQPISLQLLGAGAVSGGSPFDPWIISFSLPIGAAIAIWRAGKARRDAKAAGVAELEMFGGS